jgi:hypothetical protein
MVTRRFNERRMAVGKSITKRVVIEVDLGPALERCRKPMGAEGFKKMVDDDAPFGSAGV